MSAPALALVPDDGDHDDTAEATPQASLFEDLMAEAVSPLVIELPDGDRTASWTIEAVDSDGVCELDELTHPFDYLEALLGEDLADDVIDLLEPLPFHRTVDLVADVRSHFSLVELPRGMWPFLVEQLDLYGADIESDLRPWDLLDYFRGHRPWTQLIRVLGRLPEGSRYAAAVLSDEDLARERLAAAGDVDDDETEERSSRPGLVGETQDRALLRAVANGIQRLEWAVFAAQVGKKAGRPPKGMKSPETAEERVRDEIADDEVAELFDAVTPGWRDGAPAGFQQRGSGLYVPTD